MNYPGLEPNKKRLSEADVSRETLYAKTALAVFMVYGGYIAQKSSPVPV